MAQIHELMPQAMKAVGAIGKTHEKTEGSRYKFRSVDDVLSRCGPVLADLGITVAVKAKEYKVESWMQERPGKEAQRQFHATLLMGVEFFASDGSSIENVLAGEGLDYAGDKATNKAMSAAFKYGMFFGLVIPVDSKSIEDSDRSRRKSQPADDSPVDKARKAIATADSKRFVRFKEEITDRIGKGEYTAEETKVLVWALNQRANELKVPNGQVEQHA